MKRLLLAEVTDEIRIAERGEWFINDAQAGSIIHASEPTMFSHPICRVHELPSLAELGRVAVKAWQLGGRLAKNYEDLIEGTGQAILDALAKRTEPK